MLYNKNIIKLVINVKNLIMKFKKNKSKTNCQNKIIIVYKILTNNYN